MLFRSGVIRFGSRVIDEDKHHNYGLLTFKGVIVKSSNVGAIKIGLKVGAERMSEYVRRYGFGKPISPDFRGESPGIVWSASKLTDSALASVSMGYQVGVTPLQMAAAMTAVANGGELLQPRLVRAVIRDQQRQPVPRKVLGRVITPEVAAELADIMEGVVTDGTGKNARIEGYTVAGKTGTANKVENGRYSPTDYNVSFAGFLPSRKPQFVIVVVVDTPHKVPPYGSTVAAPIFHRIAEAALRQYGVAPTVNPAPPIVVARNEPQSQQPAVAELEPRPPLGVIAPDKAIVTLANAASAGTAGNVALFPDLRGLSAREALRALAQLGLTARLNGNGLVVEQNPAPGTPIERGTSSTLWLERRLAGNQQP